MCVEMFLFSQSTREVGLNTQTHAAFIWKYCCVCVCVCGSVCLYMHQRLRRGGRAVKSSRRTEVNGQLEKSDCALKA